jgi:hypothetical protein
MVKDTLMKYYQLIFSLFLLMAVGGHRLQASDHPDFSGTWTPDLNAQDSTSMAPILEAQGASRIEQKAADILSITQIITQTDKTLTIKTDSSLKNRSQVLLLDGSTQTQDTDRLGKVEFRSYWDKDGVTLITISKYITPDGRKAEWTIRRFLQDNGGAMIVEHLFTLEDGRKITGKRVLRKQ